MINQYEIGAKIKSYIKLVLLETDTIIIAFQPHPVNLFDIRKTVSKLGPDFQKRFSLFRIGLGDARLTSVISCGNASMDDSVIVNKIGDFKGQRPTYTYRGIIIGSVLRYIH